MSLEESSSMAALGLPQHAIRVYLALLDLPAAQPQQIAAVVGEDLEDVQRSLDLLRDHGLALRDKGHALASSTEQWTAAEPDHAVRDLVRRHEDALHGIRTALPDLQSRFLRAHGPGGDGHPVEFVSGWENIGIRYHQIIRDAVSDVCLWDHAPYTPGPAPTEQEVLDRGITFRILCDAEQLPAELSAEFTNTHGLAARRHPSVAFRGVIADGRSALITMDRGATNHTALVVGPSPLLDGLAHLYEMTWSMGVPVGQDRDGAPLEEGELEVLKLLATGHKDEAIARQLGTTSRTVRRRVSNVLDALLARSRFQGGVEAQRRGWV